MARSAAPLLTVAAVRLFCYELGARAVALATESGRNATASGFGGRYQTADLIRAGGSAMRRQLEAVAPRQGAGIGPLDGNVP
jgi:hypothetical protein